MICVELAYILYAEIINYEGKQDRSPFEAPQTRGLGSLLVVVLEKACLQEGVGEAAVLRETIDAVVDFEIHPSLVDIVVEVVLVDELLRDVSDIDYDVFGIVKWRC